MNALSRQEIECQPFLRSKSTEYVTKRSIDSKSMRVESIKSIYANDARQLIAKWNHLPVSEG